MLLDDAIFINNVYVNYSFRVASAVLLIVGISRSSMSPPQLMSPPQCHPSV